MGQFETPRIDTPTRTQSSCSVSASDDAGK